MGVHKVVALCSHAFCASCLCLQIDRNPPEKLDCAVCRQKIVYIITLNRADIDPNQREKIDFLNTGKRKIPSFDSWFSKVCGPLSNVDFILTSILG